MKNSDVAQAFANGSTDAEGSHYSVKGDILYSYAMPIAKRLPDGTFQISNNMRALGGEPVSQTTSQHIGLAHYFCKPAVLVETVKVH